MLRVESVAKTYAHADRVLCVLEDSSFEVKTGEFVTIHGPSGCGKTTALLIAGGLLSPDRGTVTVDGQALYAMSPEARSRFRAGHIGFVFQQFHLIPYLSVLDNVLVPALAGPLPDAQSRAMGLISRFNLGDRFDHRPAELSTGERQRVALARALLHGPKLLLADEPTGNLDPENAEEALKHLADIARGGTAVLMVSHSDVARSYATRFLTIRGGRIVEA